MGWDWTGDLRGLSNLHDSTMKSNSSLAIAQLLGYSYHRIAQLGLKYSPVNAHFTSKGPCAQSQEVWWMQVGVTHISVAVVLTCAPWEVRDILIGKDHLVLQHICQVSQPGSADDGNLWALSSAGTQPVCCFLVHLIAISAGGEEVSEPVTPSKE